MSERLDDTRLDYKIHGLCCAEEVALLKKALLPLVRDEDRLHFDVLNSRMSIDVAERADGNGNGVTTPQQLERAVASTGMKAVPWAEHERARAETPPSWRDHTRTIFCVGSGVAFAAAFGWHAATEGVATALTASEQADAGYPLPTTILYLLSLALGARFFLPKAYYAVKNLRPDINLLMAVAVLGALGLRNFFEAAFVAFLFAVALLLESWSVGRARNAITALMDLSPQTARFRPPQAQACSSCCCDDTPDANAATEASTEEREAEVGEVPLDATVIVHPGERVPLDGVVTAGRSSINQAPITGESVPVSKEIGDEVYAGTINNEGALEFRVTKRADDTSLARIIRMVEEAQSRRAPSEQWVETFARYYTPAMMALALGIAVLPPLVLGLAWADAIYMALVMLLIACPCALVISTPVSVVSGLAAAARHGVLVKGGVFLEAPARLRVIAFDKTGTLTHGEPRVETLLPADGIADSDLLARTAAIEARSGHPLAQAIVLAAEQRKVARPDATDHEALAGMGAAAAIEGDAHWAGNRRLAMQHGVPPEHPLFPRADALAEVGQTLVFAGRGDTLLGVLGIVDTVRAESAPAIARLKQLGIAQVVLLTGDHERTAKRLAATLGIDRVHAGLMPEDKAALVEELRAEHGRLAMVGDGINDAPAMATADVGIAMGAVGSDAAIETADIALMGDDLHRLPWLLEHSRRTLRVIQQNIALALGLKLLVLVLALLGFATLWLAILADMGASLLVIGNALRLLRTRPRPEEAINAPGRSEAAAPRPDPA